LNRTQACTKKVKTFTSKTQCLDHEISKYAVSVKQAYLGKLFVLGLFRLLTGDRINAILDLIGYRKKYAGCPGTGRDAIRHYEAIPKFEDVDVDRIFAYWLDRDMKSQENSGAGDDSLALAYTDGDILEIISEMCQAPDKETLDLLSDAYLQEDDRLKQRVWAMMTQEQKTKVREAKNNFAGDLAGDFALA
jgi:hypothetical protein